MRALPVAGIVVLVTAAIAGILWAGSRGFGMRQAIEFFPYDRQIELDDGTVIRSSGVVVRVNDHEAVPDDRAMAGLMLAAREMYPDECSGENWEVAVRRPLPGIGEEKYSCHSSIYDSAGPGPWIEYGRWVDDTYVVLDSYQAQWSEIGMIATGDLLGFSIRIE